MSTGAKPHAELDRVRPRAGGWLLLAALVILLVAAAIVVRPSWFRVGEERITADSIGASFNAVAELAVEEYVYSNVGSFDKEGLVLRGFEVPFTGRNFLVSYDGVVRAGVKHADAITAKVDNAAQQLQLTVPQVEVLSSTIDAESVVVHDQSMNPLNQVRVEDVTEFIAEQERSAKEQAVEQGLLDRASDRVEDLLESHARALIAGTPLEGYEVSFMWTNG